MIFQCYYWKCNKNFDVTMTKTLPEKHIISFCGLVIILIRPKKLIICFSGTVRVTFKPPHQKFLLHFQYSHWKIVCTSRIVSLGRPSFAAILFVDWLVCILKVKIFSGNYSDTSFYIISFEKIKNKKPPARLHHFLKKSAWETYYKFFLA